MHSFNFGYERPGFCRTGGPGRSSETSPASAHLKVTVSFFSRQGTPPRRGVPLPPVIRLLAVLASSFPSVAARALLSGKSASSGFAARRRLSPPPRGFALAFGSGVSLAPLAPHYQFFLTADCPSHFFLDHVDGDIVISIGKISSLPSSMAIDSITVENCE